MAEKNKGRLIIGIGGWGTSTVPLIYKHLGPQPHVRYIAIDTDRDIQQSPNLPDPVFEEFKANHLHRVLLHGEYGEWLDEAQMYQELFDEKYSDVNRESRGEGTEKEPQYAFILGLMGWKLIKQAVRDAAAQLEENVDIGDWDNVIITGGGGSAGRGLSVLTAAIVQETLRAYNKAPRMTICAYTKDCYEVAENLERDIEMNYIAFLREIQHFMENPFEVEVHERRDDPRTIRASNFIHFFVPFSRISHSRLNTGANLGVESVPFNELTEGLAIYLALNSNPSLGKSITSARTDIMRDYPPRRRILGIGGYQIRLSDGALDAAEGMLKQRYAKRLINGELLTNQLQSHGEAFRKRIKESMISERDLRSAMWGGIDDGQPDSEPPLNLRVAPSAESHRNPYAEFHVNFSPEDFGENIIDYIESVTGLRANFEKIEQAVERAFEDEKAERTARFPDSLQRTVEAPYETGLTSLITSEVEQLIQQEVGVNFIIDHLQAVLKEMQFEENEASPGGIENRLRAQLASLIRMSDREIGEAAGRVNTIINGEINLKLERVSREMLSALYRPVRLAVSQLLDNLKEMREALTLTLTTPIQMPEPGREDSRFDIQITPSRDQIQKQLPPLNSDRFETVTFSALFNEEGFNEAALWRHFGIDAQIQSIDLLTENTAVTELLQRGTQLSYKDLWGEVNRKRYFGVPRGILQGLPRGIQYVKSPSNSKMYYVVEDYGLELSFLRDAKELEQRLLSLPYDPSKHYIDNEMHQRTANLYEVIGDQSFLFTPALLFGLEPPVHPEMYPELASPELPDELTAQIADDALIQHSPEGWYIRRDAVRNEDRIRLGTSFASATETFTQNRAARDRVNRFLGELESQPEIERLLKQKIAEYTRILEREIRRAERHAVDGDWIEVWGTMLTHLQAYERRLDTIDPS